MRIIAGNLKGRSIRLPKGSRTRPTTGAVRELLMNLLGERISGLPFLDLCAGSGITGFEALSRGASLAIFVETDQRMADQLRETVSAWKLEGSTFVLQQDVRRCWKSVMRRLDGELLGTAFLDAPFIPGMAAELLRHCSKGRALFRPEAFLVVRTPERLPETVHGFTLAQRRGQGPATLWCYAPAGLPLVAENPNNDGQIPAIAE